MAAAQSRGPNTVTEIELFNPTGVPQANSYVRIPRSLGIINQRLYREHRGYYAEINLSARDAQTTIEVYTIAPNWFNLGALRMAKEVYDKAMREERKMVASPGRWHDFHLRMGIPGADELLPGGIDGTLSGGNLQETVTDISGSSWPESLITDDNGTTKAFALFGASSSTQYNVFDEYDAMGNISQDPSNPTATGGYDRLDGSVREENIVALQVRGASPPYNPDTMNTRMVKVGELYSTASGNQSLSTGVFYAPLGLVYLKGYAAVGTNLCTLNVVPGTYKGVHTSAL